MNQQDNILIDYLALRDFFGNFNGESDLTLDIDKNTNEITYMFDRCK